MRRTVLENSIDTLKTLYMVVAGLALACGLQQFVFNESGQFEIEWISLETLFFVIFVTTVIRFAHGAMRHFDRSYSENPKSVNWRISQPLLDFLGLGIEAFIFFILAYSLDDQWRFIDYYLCLLIVDCLWLFITSLPNIKRFWLGNIKWWTAANLLVLVPTGVLIIFFHIRGIEIYPSYLLWVFIVGVAIHTIADYPLNWEFYFGRSFILPWSSRTK
jgi:hypothetical protein